MKKIIIFISLWFPYFLGFSQTYIFNNESKLTKQKKSDKWQSKLIYNNFKFDWCDIYPKTDSCFNIETIYCLEKRNDTIYIKSMNPVYKFKIHPQYSLNKKDTLLFLMENIEGLKNGSTSGNTVYIKDTIISIKKVKIDCYLFKHFATHRNREDVEYICLDKKTFIPINSWAYSIDLNKNEIITTAFKKRKLFKVCK